MIKRKILSLRCSMLIPLKQYKHHIVKKMVLYLDKMQDNNVLQCVCALIYHNMKGNPGDLKQVICILKIKITIVCHK